MSKKLSIITNGGAAAFADAGLKLSKIIDISIIETHKDFQSLYGIEEELLERIVNSMTESGYDNSQPLHIWRVTDEETKTVHNYLIDGYTRWAALKRVGIKTAPYYEHNFETFDEAYKYVLTLQVNRRNLENAELLKNVSKLMETDFIQNAPNKAKAVADALGVSTRTAKRAISVEKNADEETKEEVRTGKISLNKALKKTHQKSVVPRGTSDSENSEPVSDALEDTSDNPRSISIQTRDMSEQKQTEFQGSEYDDRMRERFQDGFYEGFKRGFSAAVDSLYETIRNIITDDNLKKKFEHLDVFQDLSFEVVASKLNVSGDPDLGNIPTGREGILKEFNV